jgi:1,4-alpha-glucan branching enzyme
MGGEFGATEEWNHEQELNWAMASEAPNAGITHWVTDLNQLLRNNPSLHDNDCDASGFAWVVGDDAANSVYAFLRYDDQGQPLLFVANFTPIVRDGYRLGVPVAGDWGEVLNSDNLRYGGSGILNQATITTEVIASHGYEQSLIVTVPPLAGVFLTPV